MITISSKATRPRFQGIVKWFSPEKCYGFIELPEESDGTRPPDVFVHYRGIRIINGQHFRNLKDGQHVDFEIVKGEKGPQANDVIVTFDPNAQQDPADLPEAA